MNDILVPVSPGELLDKITILRIKAARIQDPDKLVHVRHELHTLESLWHGYVPGEDFLRAEIEALERVNAALWDIEDRIRIHEARQRFDADFIELARAVYITNDERAAVKKRINIALHSTIVEEKSYQPYH